MTDIESALRRPPAVEGEVFDRLHRALVAGAEREGLLDLAVAEIDSPLGRLLLAATPRGLARIAYQEWQGPGGKPVNAREAVLERLARDVSPRILEAPRRLDPARRQLDEYFERRRRRFELDLDWSLIRGFTRSVLETTARIPFGEVSTYGEVAAAAGNPRASRAAGNALGANPIPIVIPCHRVLRAGHGLGGYTGGLDKKEHLLRIEGVLTG
jgi:methylated-DNA-[protein]-cysteine S-methyltransferase